MAEKTAKFITKKPVRHNGKRLQRNAVIVLLPKHAAHLVNHGAIAPLGGEVEGVEEELGEQADLDQLTKSELIAEGVKVGVELKSSQTADEMREAIAAAREALEE